MEFWASLHSQQDDYFCANSIWKPTQEIRFIVFGLRLFPVAEILVTWATKLYARLLSYAFGMEAQSSESEESVQLNTLVEPMQDHHSMLIRS